MKKGILSIAAIALFSGALLFSGCGKDDTVKPTITLLGNASDVVVYKSASTYTDPGATANDDQDGDITSSITVTGSVDMNNAGDYTLEYSVSDKAGNTNSVTRTVTVDAAPYVAGSYSHVDIIDGTSYPAEIELLTASSVTKNKVFFAKFAGYTNATPYCTILNSSLTIPGQTFTCGLAPQVPRTFVSTSSASFTASGFTVYYTITEAGVSVNCSSTYTKQ